MREGGGGLGLFVVLVGAMGLTEGGGGVFDLAGCCGIFVVGKEILPSFTALPQNSTSFFFLPPKIASRSVI